MVCYAAATLSPLSSLFLPQSYGISSAQNAPSFSSSQEGFLLIIAVSAQISPLLGDLPWRTHDSIYMSCVARMCWLSCPPSFPPYKLCESSNLVYLVPCVSPGLTLVFTVEWSFSQFWLNEWMNKWISLWSSSQWLLSLLLWQRLLYFFFGKLVFLWTHLRQFLHSIMNLHN